ncbi:MAG TPA: M48 family metalloprotease [Pirellulales bacterium]|nr:M48 family metalloprotease [Pirellulales bacterium]
MATSARFSVAWIRCLTVLGLCAGYPPAQGAELPLGETSMLRFAEPREGVLAITRRDEYFRQMSPFDRQVRLKTDRDVSTDELLAFIAGNVVPWQSSDRERVTSLVASLSAKLVPWKLKLPPEILLVKTTGREEANAAYCRGATIVLPQAMIDSGHDRLAHVLAHEVFHVLSSHNPELREALYAAIGFKACNDVPLPPPLTERKITNPDAPVNDHFITVQWNGQSVDAMPVLFSKAEHYDPVRGGNIFSLMSFKLMVLAGADATRQAALVAGKPVLLDPASVPDFAAQVGRNTQYLIHPEEILADNFVFLVNGRIDIPSRDVVKKMAHVLRPERQAP